LVLYFGRIQETLTNSQTTRALLWSSYMIKLGPFSQPQKDAQLLVDVLTC
jgi:hypothetical protein